MNPKQLIYDALNWLGATIPDRQPDDNKLIIEAYQRILKFEDRQSQELFARLIDELQRSNEKLSRIAKAWQDSKDRLKEACKLINDSHG